MALQIKPCSRALGAEITGADLTQALDDATFAQIRAAFYQHEVIYFRGQHGIVAPAGISREVLDKLHGATVSAMRSAEVNKRFSDDGATVTASTPEEFRALIRRETAKWTQIVKSAGMTVQ